MTDVIISISSTDTSFTLMTERAWTWHCKEFDSHVYLQSMLILDNGPAEIMIMKMANAGLVLKNAEYSMGRDEDIYNPNALKHFWPWLVLVLVLGAIYFLVTGRVG